MDRFEKRTLGRSGLRSSRLGLASSYGVGTPDVERAFERGVNYFYWGSRRRRSFGQAIANLAPRHREEMVVVVQSYTRVAWMMRGSLQRALRSLRIDSADLLLLGWWQKPPPRRIVDAALALKEAGLAKKILISCHHRPTFEAISRDPAFDAIMVRYNAAHPGAEREVFPLLPANKPGVVAYTATRWGALMNPSHVPSGEPVPRASDCYRFALTHPAVDVCLAGPKNAAELDEALLALERGPMSDEEIAWMKRVGASVRSAAMMKTGNPAVQMLDRLFARKETPQTARQLGP